MPSRKSKNSRRRSRRASKSRKNARRGMRGGSLGSLVPAVFPPQVGSPYDATSTSNAPTGNFLSLSKVGIPSGGMYPPEPSNPQFSGGGRRRKSSKKRSSRRSRRGGKKSKRGGKKSKRSSGKKGRKGMRSRGMRSRSSRRKGMRGGGLSMFMSSLLPDDVINVGRSVPSAFEQLSDKFNGLISPASYQVYPTNQPLAMATSSTHSGAVPMPPTNINAIYNSAAARVNGI